MAEVDAGTRLAYRYSPIDKNKGQIRLFRLLPQLQGGLIQCEIFHQDLPSPQQSQTALDAADSTVGYWALSYEWGPPKPLRQVMINDSILSIRDNLWQFLGVLCRLELTDMPLWADQICINQEDTMERNHQVLLMSTIYSSASVVLAWLGYCDDFTEELTLALQEAPCGSDKSGREDSSDTSELCERCKCIACTHERNPKGIEYVFNATYWTRVWIIQELALAREVVFLINDHMISRPSLERAGEYWKTAVGTDIMRILKTAQVQFILACIGIQPKLTLKACLLGFVSGDLRCTEPRDLIYALVGLLATTERPVINYSLPTDVVLENVIVQCLFRPGNLNHPEEETRRFWAMRIHVLRQHMGLPRYWYRWLDLGQDRVNKDFCFAFGAFEKSISSLLATVGRDTTRWSIRDLALILRVAMMLIEPSMQWRYDVGNLTIEQSSDAENMLRSYVTGLNIIDMGELNDYLYRTALAWTTPNSPDAELLGLLASTQ